MSPIPFTKQGYQKIQDENALLLSKRPEAVENLRRAREMGDLSENGYYKAARARLSSLDARLRKLSQLIRLGKIITTSGSGCVEIGSRVTVTDGTKQHEYTIVGSYESDPSKQTISHLSPIGRALMGKQIQDTIEVYAPAGVLRYTIVDVTS